MYPNSYAGGNISVVISNGCGSITRKLHINSCDNSNSIIIKNKAIDKPNSELIGIDNSLQMQIFPNPSTNEFKLHVNTLEKAPISVRIMDANGRMMKKINMMPYDAIIFGNEFKAGVYWIEVIQAKNTITQRVVKF